MLQRLKNPYTTAVLLQRAEISSVDPKFIVISIQGESLSLYSEKMLKFFNAPKLYWSESLGDSLVSMFLGRQRVPWWNKQKEKTALS